MAGILTVIGGFNSNELLPHLDWELIRANPKIFCGFSDITALQNAILARAGLVTYLGPHWSSFGMRDHFDQTLDWFQRACLSDAAFDVRPATSWTDDLWFLDQDSRGIEPSDGWWVLNSGSARGRLVGGNLCTFNLLQGTWYWPDLAGAIIAVEDDERSDPVEFGRDLTSLLQQPGAEQIAGLMIGRFQRASRISRPLLEQILAKHDVLDQIPVVANMDFGHTSPLMTLPIGGEVRLAAADEPLLRIYARGAS